VRFEVVTEYIVDIEKPATDVFETGRV